MQRYIPLFLAVCLVLGTGCASRLGDAASKAGIKTVQVEPRVDTLSGMRYGVVIRGGAANAIAAMITDAAGSKGVSRMSEVMAKHEISVPQIVRDRLQARLQQHPALQIVNGEKDAQGVVFAKIVTYGYDAPGFKFSVKCPIIELRLELRDSQGKKLWSTQNSAGQLTSQDLGATWDEYEKDPERLRADWIKQVDNILAKLLPESQ